MGYALSLLHSKYLSILILPPTTPLIECFTRMELKKATLEQIPALREICTSAYAFNFASHWNEGGLDWYLDREFSIERLSADLVKPEIEYFFVVKEKQTVGFVKFNTQTNLPGLPDREGCELQKIYLLPEMKGAGIGKVVLQILINRARSMDKRIFSLCVLDTNLPAIAFYKKSGFNFHSNFRLDIPYFQEARKGMHRMFMEL